jgi:hypothetical protein
MCHRRGRSRSRPHPRDSFDSSSEELLRIGNDDDMLQTIIALLMSLMHVAKR